jgi:heme exporter protein A
LSTPSLTILDAQCQRSGERLFAPVSCHLSGGQLAVVSGPNGSGKTTLLEALAGLSSLSDGTVSFSQSKDHQDWLHNSHYLGHKLGNKANLSCLENLQFVAAMHNFNATEPQLEQVLNECGLAGYEYQHASDLSAGQKKRLALGRLLVLSRTFWLLDEPFVNLDRAGCDWLYTVLKKHLAAGGAVIMTAHDQQQILQLADHHIDLLPEPVEACS